MKFRSILPLLLLCSVSGSGIASLAAAETESPAGFTCNGFLPDINKWAWESNESIRERFCPRNYAYYGIDRSGDDFWIKGSIVAAKGDCCRLPREDILTEEHVIAAESCPPDYVATGGIFEEFHFSDRPSDFRCTKINTARYRLGPPAPGVMWGLTSQALAPFLENRQIMRKSIPLALRSGIGRQLRTSWTTAGCIGSPIGSLLTAKLGPTCAKMIFRELQFRGLPGDPAENAPVKMYPDCSETSDIFDRETRCLP